MLSRKNAADRKEKIYDSVRQKRSMDRWMDINKYFLFFTDGKAEKIKKIKKEDGTPFVSISKPIRFLKQKIYI